MYLNPLHTTFITWQPASMLMFGSRPCEVLGLKPKQLSPRWACRLPSGSCMLFLYPPSHLAPSHSSNGSIHLCVCKLLYDIWILACSWLSSHPHSSGLGDNRTHWIVVHSGRQQTFPCSCTLLVVSSELLAYRVHILDCIILIG